MYNEAILRSKLEEYKRKAEELDISLQEYLLLLLLEELEQVPYRGES